MITICEKRLIKEKIVQEYYIEEPLNSPNKIVNFFIDNFDICSYIEEYIYLICFDIKVNVNGVYEVSHGSVDRALCDMRSIFSCALKTLSSDIVLVHNHPSGDPTPSNEDDELFDRLRKCGNILGVEVLDSIIIGSNSYYSYKESSHLYTS